MTHVTLLLNFVIIYITQYHSTLRTCLYRDKFGYESRWWKAEAHQVKKVLEEFLFLVETIIAALRLNPSDWLCLRNNRIWGSRVRYYTWFLWETMSSVIRSLYTETHSLQIKSLHHHLKTHGLEAATAHIQLKLLKALLLSTLSTEFTIFPALFYDFSSVMCVIYPPFDTMSVWECFWLELMSVI